MPRIIAFCLGMFGMANALAGFWRAELDANLWWIDMRGLPDGIARLFLLCACGTLVTYALFPQMSPARRIVSLISAASLIAICAANSISFYALIWKGAIHTFCPIPLSALISGGLFWIASEIYRAQAASNALNWRAAVPALCACLIGFPLAQIFFFGTTDYSRPADVAIVFGARAYSDGTPSTALYDRVRTACDLQRRGVVKKLIFSGGPGDGAFHETDVMRTLAIQLGVPDSAILLDRQGVNTRATLENARGMLADCGAKRVLAVSHFYHLPRVKLESQRLGIDVLTVPAHESYTLTKMPLLIAREVAALWMYYLIS